MPIRIIAQLDVKPPFVVKPVHYEGLRKIGHSVELAKKYYGQGSDEILYIDIVASLYQREILIEQVRNTASDILIPFAAGGGIRTIDDIASLLHNGVDKVVINTHALQEDSSLISRAAEVFGSQAIVVNIVAKKWNGCWECYSDCGRMRSNKDAIEWAQTVEELGAGELLINSVDTDGRRRGYDTDLIREIVSRVKIPVIAGSGAGRLEDIRKIIVDAKPDAVAIASLLHYNVATVGEIKQYLHDSGIEVAL